MKFTFECPACKRQFQLGINELAQDGLKCCLCGNEPAPDIMTAYQHVGKTMVDLYGCCDCADASGWLPRKIEK